jgi:hypothetical protein
MLLILLMALLILMPLLILGTFLILIVIPLTNWSLEPLLKTRIRIGAIVTVAPRELSFPLSLPVHFVARIIKHNGTIHQSLKV